MCVNRARVAWYKKIFCDTQLFLVYDEYGIPRYYVHPYVSSKILPHVKTDISCCGL